MNSFNISSLVTFSLFNAFFVGTNSFASCQENRSGSTGLVQCVSKISRLETLFTTIRKQVSTAESLPNIYTQKMQIPIPTKSPVRNAFVPNTVVVSNPIFSKSFPENVKNVKYSEVVSISTNKSLSKYGPDEPAEFIVRCYEKQLNVLLNFPGYPMNDKKQENVVSYQVDNAKKWATHFQPAIEFSAISIPRNNEAYSFLSSIKEGRNLRINTQDIEGTQITAEFDISYIASKLESLSGNCRMPT